MAFIILLRPIYQYMTMTMVDGGENIWICSLVIWSWAGYLFIFLLIFASKLSSWHRILWENSVDIFSWNNKGNAFEIWRIKTSRLIIFFIIVVQTVWLRHIVNCKFYFKDIRINKVVKNVFNNFLIFCVCRIILFCILKKKNYNININLCFLQKEIFYVSNWRG